MPKPSRRILPAFGLSLGYTLTYTSLVVLLPLAALLIKSLNLDFSAILTILKQRQVQAAFWLTLSASFIAALLNIPIGLLLAWVLTRYRFPGRRLMDSLIDLPFALPTAIAGISLAFLYSKNGWLGSLFHSANLQYPWILWRGFKTSNFPLEIAWYKSIALAPLGIVVALMFVGLPFLVRTIQPVIQEISPESEDASASLGASRLQTFLRVLLPEIFPALLTGFALAFARGVGEYGSVLFITGSQPDTLIVSHLIIQRIETEEISSATVVATTLLFTSFFILITINLLQRRLTRHL